MIVHVDLSSIPPVVEVREADNLKELKTVVAVAQHTWIDQQTLHPSGGSVATVADEKFAAMVSYAEQHGWVDERGRVRAHVETEHLDSPTPDHLPAQSGQDKA